MIRRFILSRVAYWSSRFVEEAKLSNLLQGVPIGRHAEHFATRARRRRDRWKRIAYVLLGVHPSADSTRTAMKDHTKLIEALRRKQELFKRPGGDDGFNETFLLFGQAADAVEALVRENARLVAAESHDVGEGHGTREG